MDCMRGVKRINLSKKILIMKVATEIGSHLKTEKVLILFLYE